MHLDTQTLVFNKPLKENAVYVLFTSAHAWRQINYVIWVRFISMLCYFDQFACWGAV